MTERGMPLVSYEQTPNTVRRDVPCFDMRLFKGSFSLKPLGLRCGCPSEEKCLHFRWPVKEGADKGRSMRCIEAAGGDQVFAGLQLNSPDSGMDMGTEGVRVPDGQSARAEKQDIQDSAMVMGDEPTSEVPPLPAK